MEAVHEVDGQDRTEGILAAITENMMLKHEIDTLNARIDRLLEIDADWYELKGWLRLCADDPDGHAEFYAWAGHYMFGDPEPEE